MDHNEALRMQAAAKYVLGELSPVLREEYEEHFFDCTACALDVKAATDFLNIAREVLRQRPDIHRLRHSKRWRRARQFHPIKR
jgi:anti-sigma factor RsiW